MRRKTAITLFLQAVFWLMLFPCAAPSEERRPGIEATAAQLAAGVAVIVDGAPGFVKYTGPAGPGDVLELDVAGMAGQVAVRVAPPEKKPEETIVVPVLIEDKTLAKGVNMNLATPRGDSAVVRIPPKRVFLSIPFSIPVTGDVHPDFAQSDRKLMIQVVPKITKKAQVDMENTATEGLVADIKYEGLAYLKFKDILNRTNRRDLDGTFFFGREVDYRWSLIIENMFEKFDDSTVGVMKNQRLSGDVQSQWRLDNINDLHSARFGLNMVHDDGEKFYAKAGNIDRVVKGVSHVELGYGPPENRFLTRFEGIEAVNPSGRSAFALKADRFGYQYRIEGGNDRTYYKGRFGNLKVQDFNDEGEIDDYFNTDFLFVTQLGRNNSGWTGSKLNFSGEVDFRIFSRGSNSWVEGGLDLNLGIGRNYLVLTRYNSDFMPITGKPTEPLWENIFVSFVRLRNYFDPEDPLAKFDLDSIFIDLDYSREGQGAAFDRRIRFGFSRFMRVWKYDLPVEIFIETVKPNVFRPGIALSIRRYL